MSFQLTDDDDQPLPESHRFLPTLLQRRVPLRILLELQRTQQTAFWVVVVRDCKPAFVLRFAGEAEASELAGVEVARGSQVFRFEGKRIPVLIRSRVFQEPHAEEYCYECGDGQEDSDQPADSCPKLEPEALAELLEAIRQEDGRRVARERCRSGELFPDRLLTLVAGRDWVPMLEQYRQLLASVVAAGELFPNWLLERVLPMPAHPRG